MALRQIPLWVRHAPAPGVRGFALLNGIESVTRGILISVFPLAMYDAFGAASSVSAIYFVIGIASLFVGLLVPGLTRLVPRRYAYSFGVSLYIVGSALFLTGSSPAAAAGLAAFTFATVISFVCLNAYVLDYVARAELGRCETLRMFYSALAWTAGPVAGVWLREWWAPAPFVLSMAAAVALLATFWVMRLGDGRLITRARAPAPNPFAFVGRFAVQPRLVSGWLFAVLRSCGWWIYVVYLPIFAIEAGLGDQVGGTVLSVTNATLFATPLMLRFVQRVSVRGGVRTGFAGSGLMFAAAWWLSGSPWIAIGCLYAGSLFLILLDICGQLPFLMSVKPSERTEMSAIYSSYRDVSSILTPGAAWAILLVMPVAGIFLAGAVGLGVAWALAGRLHPRLGAARMPRAEGEAA